MTTATKLRANVDAVRTVLENQDKKLSPQQIEVVKRFSGFGSAKELPPWEELPVKSMQIPEGQMIWDDQIVDIPTEFDEEDTPWDDSIELDEETDEEREERHRDMAEMEMGEGKYQDDVATDEKLLQKNDTHGEEETEYTRSTG